MCYCDAQTMQMKFARFRQKSSDYYKLDPPKDFEKSTRLPVKPPSQHQKATSQDDREKIIWHIMQSRGVRQSETCIRTSPRKKWIQTKIRISNRKQQQKKTQKTKHYLV